MNKKYYIYKWYNIDNGYVFYIGKGSNNRYKEKRRRNRLWNDYYSNNNCASEIIKYYDTDEGAFQAEKEAISKYKKINQCCANIDNGGDICGRKGKNNSQYGISPKERMAKDVYDKWVIHLQEQIGNKNPNYGNHKLSKIYRENKDLALEKQSRKGEQNGSSKKVKMYNSEMKLVKEFDYIGLCIDYLIDNGYTRKNTKRNSLYSLIYYANKNKTKYLNHYFKY